MSKRNYITLRELIYDRKLEAAVLATAVERQGIYTWDRFGRFVKFHDEFEDEYRKSLDLIARAYSPDPMDSTEELDFEDEYGNNRLDAFGWPYDECPDFEKIATTDPLVTRANPPAFVSVNDILVKRKAHPGAVAAWIEAHGIWAFNEYQSLDLYPANSRQAQQVLAGIAYRVASDTQPVDADFDSWYLDQDPTYSHGWPGDRVPRFSKEPQEVWHSAQARLEVRRSFFAPNLLTIGRVLVLQEATPGDIATLIEREGIYGFDEYGRVVQYKADTAQARQALEALKHYTELSFRGSITPDLLKLTYDSFSRFGWLPACRPSTGRAAATSSPAAATGALTPPAAAGPAVVTVNADDSDIGNRKSSYDALVLGLLCFIRGEITGVAHSNWKAPNGQNELIKQIREKIPRLRGIGDTNIRKMFGSANKLRPEANLPMLNQAQEDTGNAPFPTDGP